MRIDITKAQLMAIIQIRDDVSAMVGSSEDYDDKGNSWDKPQPINGGEN